MSLKDFQTLSCLGQGSYSSVYKVRRHKDSKEYALKKVKIGNLSDKEKENALNEVRILASINHPNIIAYKEAFLDEPTNSLCIVMEYADDGDLYQKIEEHTKNGTVFEETQIWNILIQILKGLKTLHKANILHRDLKSANVFLFKNGDAKLGDMNVSKVSQKGLCQTQAGTPYYASPEVWKDRPYDNKSDMWSMGCVTYEMASLKPPFRAQDMEGLYKKVIRGLYPRIPSIYSSDLSNVIRCMLQVVPDCRPTAEKMLTMSSMVRINGEPDEKEEGEVNLMNTIKIPKNLTFLAGQLPKPKYEDKKGDRRARHTRTMCHIQSETERNYGSKEVLKPSVSMNKMVSPLSKVRRQDKQTDIRMRKRESSIGSPESIVLGYKLPPIKR